jgi:VCBS repeat-containing protein
VPVTGTIIGDIGTATDPDGDPLNYTVTTQPKNGTVALVGTAYTYTPSAVELTNGGSDSFTVTIDDLQGAADHFYAPNGHTTTETINLTVAGTGIVVPPVVTATQGPRDSIGVVHGGFTVVNPPGTTGNTFSLANGNSPGATATSAFSSLGGIVSLNATTGNWTYIPAVSGNLLGIPTHTDSFVVTVDNGQSSVQDTVTVGADLETAVTATSTNQTNGAYSGGLNIPPADGGLLTYSVGTPPSSKGTVVVNADGSFTYTPTAAARHAAAATNATTAAKTDSFTIVGTDANGRQITVATVPVTISATNTAPTASYSVTNPGSNGQVTGIIMASDADNDTLSYGATSTTSSKGGAVTVNAATGTFSYQPTAGAMHAASAENATTADKQDTFTVTVDDGHGGDTSVPVTVSIKPQNTAPTVSYGTPLKVTGVATYTPTYTDVDGDSVSYTVTTAPTHGTVLVNLSVLGVTTLVYTANNLLLPSHDSFTVTVDDGHGGTAVTTLNPY